ncbi:MaoC/PaaZ C-terminal domain-containing protein [Streptomyces sp. NBC_01016]|uniref:MaoC/PaaZ C-terminal domain-containing protein n=1 Tax=Streptomyces sp. NBC_01016 TaxID=2903720 RepID=UPI0022517EE4|nr:MaoC/PaaZ C-terminal domain-containing protein [Streptomyces sp. NBC_01016]MCX4834381.1 MaoC/PaaZ C-terminal domain-containing protein [Streptomyces sp. NBC_01016]
MTLSTPLVAGTVLEPLHLPPISRTTLALFAGASGDDNPIHIDLDAARTAGLDDVFAHGMLSMAYLGRLLTGWAPQERIRSFDVRFVAITPLHARPTCRGTVRAVEDGIAAIDLDVRLADGTTTLTGTARVVAS